VLCAAIEVLSLAKVSRGAAEIQDRPASSPINELLQMSIVEGSIVEADAQAVSSRVSEKEMMA